VKLTTLPEGCSKSKKTTAEELNIQADQAAKKAAKKATEKANKDSPIELDDDEQQRRRGRGWRQAQRPYL
jgi:hypothetical protein